MKKLLCLLFMCVSLNAFVGGFIAVPNGGAPLLADIDYTANPPVLQVDFNGDGDVTNDVVWTQLPWAPNTFISDFGPGGPLDFCIWEFTGEGGSKWEIRCYLNGNLVFKDNGISLPTWI